MGLSFGIRSGGALLILAGGLMAGTQAGAVTLATHRAVYNLELGSASERSGISQMFGKMVYEFTGSECAGYRVNFRFVTKVETSGETKLTDQQITSFEDLPNKSFEFETKTYNGKTLDKTISGNARKTGKGIAVDLFSPTTQSIRLPDGRFPTEHMIEVISRAEKGDSFFESKIYDASDNADKLLYTTTVLGKKTNVEPADTDAGKAGVLGKDPVWPVTIAYFNDASGADELPIYRISFKLYDNGVTRDLSMDYGDFTLTGKLTELKMLDPTPCPVVQ